ncbi:MAG: protein kinase [Gemmatimonadetes bacterium]|nr:protein kinase [Gemmatimonadota bacterium]
MTDGLRCSSCESPLDPTDTFCRQCGMPLIAADPTAPPPDGDGTLAELRTALAPGIHVLRPLGAGGMGSVYLGRDPALKRSVAIKVLTHALAQDPVARARFTREAEAAAAVSHPHVVSVYQVGELAPSGVPYLVMQFVEGPTLQGVLHEGEALPEPRVRRIVGEVASALATAHAHGLVHRDIKPGNIMLDQESGRAVVLDFGISAVLEKRKVRGEEKLTATGTSIGTPMYMSPEQAAGDAVTDRSDVYSLGVVAFELATGRPPFIESSAMGLIAAHMKEAPPDLHSLRGDLDPQLADLVNRCLAKDPLQRPSAADVARALLPAGGTIIEWPPPGLERLRGLGARLLRTLGLLAALGLVLFVHLLVQPTTSMLCCWNQPEGSGIWKGFKAAIDATLPVRTDDTDTVYVWAIIVMVIVDVALVLVVIVAFRAWRLASRLHWARRSGYPWPVLLDVALDSHPDTGALLNRTGVYALVSDGERQQLLRLRHLRAAFALGTVSFALAAPWLWFRAAQWLGGPGGGSTTFVSTVEVLSLVVPALVGMIAILACARPEARVRRRGRRGESLFEAKSLPAVKSELVTGWLDLVGRRAVTKPRLVPRPVLWIIPTIAVCATVFTLALLAAGMLLEVVIAANERKGASAWIVARTVDSLRPRGWQAVDSLLSAASHLPLAARPDLDAARLLTVVWTRNDSLPAAWDVDTSGVGEAMDDGLQLRLWRRFAAAPPPVLWQYRSGFPGISNPWVLPRAQNHPSSANYLAGAQGLATRNQAAAAQALARGDKATALLRLRENLAAGRYFLRTPLVGQSLVGIEIIESASPDIDHIGRLTDDANLIVEASDLASTARELRDRMANSWRRDRFLMSDPVSPTGLRFVGDTTLAPAERWQLIAAIIAGACDNPREAFFGVDPSARRRTRQRGSPGGRHPENGGMGGAESPCAEALVDRSGGGGR